MSVRSAEFYRLADMELAKQLGALLWVMGAFVVAVLLPLAPPDESSIGDAGWVVAAAMIVGSLAFAVRLLRSPAAISPLELILQSVVAVSMVGLLMWLADEPSTYSEILLFSAIYVAAVHPPRRVLAFVAILAVVLATPLLYEPAESILAEQVARFLIWSGLTVVAAAFTARVRWQRAGLRRQGDEARTEARADPLTGLGNRRAFDEALAAATERATRSESALSTIIIDLDSFKAINDTHGLVVGDRCLRAVADAIVDVVRRPDSAFRWGGDEFAVLADVDREGAETLAERLATEVSARCRLPTGEPIRVHTGAAQLGPDGVDGDSLLTAASGALKAAGRPATG